MLADRRAERRQVWPDAALLVVDRSGFPLGSPQMALPQVRRERAPRLHRPLRTCAPPWSAPCRHGRRRSSDASTPLDVERPVSRRGAHLIAVWSAGAGGRGQTHGIRVADSLHSGGDSAHHSPVLSLPRRLESRLSWTWAKGWWGAIGQATGQQPMPHRRYCGPTPVELRKTAAGARLAATPRGSAITDPAHVPVIAEAAAKWSVGHV